MIQNFAIYNHVCIHEMHVDKTIWSLQWIKNLFAYRFNELISIELMAKTYFLKISLIIINQTFLINIASLIKLKKITSMKFKYSFSFNKLYYINRNRLKCCVQFLHIGHDRIMWYRWWMIWYSYDDMIMDDPC